MDENVIEDHLKGKIVAGIYPMLPDQTCHFLAMDFDEAGWQKDVTVVTKVCTAFNIPFAVVDQKVLWYGSINLLSYGSAQESMMRIESTNIAHELMKSIEE